MRVCGACPGARSDFARRRRRHVAGRGRDFLALREEAAPRGLPAHIERGGARDRRAVPLGRDPPEAHRHRRRGLALVHDRCGGRTCAASPRSRPSARGARGDAGRRLDRAPRGGADDVVRPRDSRRAGVPAAPARGRAAPGRARGRDARGDRRRDRRARRRRAACRDVREQSRRHRARGPRLRAPQD